MPITSFSLFRSRLPAITTVLRRHSPPYRHLFILSAKQTPSNPRQNVSKKPQPNKNLLKAKHTFKDYSSLAPVLAPNETPSLSDSQAVGAVAAAQANFMRVIVQREPEDGMKTGLELLCVVRAVLKKIKRRVLVGDKVVVGSIDWVERRGVIENVFQRSSEIVDPPVANVDRLLVLFSMEQPPVEPFMLTRFLVEAESYRIPLTLALNKTELVDEETLFAWKNRLKSWGYEPVFCSVETKNGLDSLAFYLRDQTTVIVGPSGVGKSSLINVLRSDHRTPDSLEGDNLFDPVGSKWFEDQRVGEVSTRSGRGKHTTRHVSLLPLLGGGYVADTPGFNQPSLLKVTKQSLAQAFPEIRKMLKDSEPAKCSFNDCLHLGEPGCIVKGDWERYPYYFQLLDEIRIREEFQLRTFGTKREGDVRYKVGDMGVQQAEPRLEPKKHRRQSRKRINQSLLDELDELEDDDDSLDLENDPIVRAIENEKQ
ncbi:Minichromosome maintenance family protein isoform 1 [Gossypium australe]|uniref:Minichromosome maintenance family protein isoform 1 n=1 Tax=Gossypium australe TaxID=47621 RepID=A0A5B6V2Q5_9ROSI|nr:Minichromosome maintenance family protein isoform 1 [Gossypium australe]